ncbi:MAG TPA: polymer-forming cytoskeletal protein [Pyrinomonadaceae bacterium]|nr:polymer-forming cytoskeletal protein [Pyrinomonadaceae bacterium]
MTIIATAEPFFAQANPEQVLLRFVTRTSLLFVWVLVAVVAIYAQAPAPAGNVAETTYVVEGVSDTMAYGLGRSVAVNGTVKDGAISLGGDVIVAGRVDGDVAAIGGSVIQLKGASIGGDVIVVGGTYRHDDGIPNRSPGKSTILYAGYEQELKNLIRNPTEMVSPRWSKTYVGLRILALLFWFVVSLLVTAVIPETISRGIARLQLTMGRVAIIGVIGAVIIGAGIPFSLHFLPTPLNALVGLLAFGLIVVAALFGRVVVYAATGRWLQRKLFPASANSETVALLLGTAFWITLASLPYLWPLVFSVLIVTSLGLALTARYGISWKQAKAS